ncbi:MAG: ATP synthase F1 subunit epsilon [bacterium]|nr:ATP synthase F1 subunit epsilon [bacterium]
MSIALKIYSIDKTLYEGEADAITLPGSDGELGVLAIHTPLISNLKHGIIKIRNKDAEKFIEINGGFVEIQPESKVIVLAD